MTGFADGVALLLGVLLASAGVLKLARPRPFEHALYRLLPARFDSVLLVRVAARAVGATEVVVGAGLLAVPWASNRYAIAPAGVSAALFVAFVGVIAIAVRKGTACGCFSSFSDAVAGGAELGRSIALALLAVALLAVELVGHPAGWSVTAIAWLVGAVLLVGVVAVVGGRLQPELRPAPRTDALTADVPAAAGTRERGSYRSKSGRFAGLLVGRVTSRNAAKPVQGLAVPRRRQVVIARAVRSSQSWATLAEWLGDRAARVSWSGAFAREEQVSETPEGRSGYYALSPITGAGISLLATLRFEAGDSFSDCLLLGSVDGSPVYVTGTVVMSGDKQVFVSRDAPASAPAAGATSS